MQCWIPVMRARADGKVILAGDHLQLPPTVKGYRHSQDKRKSAKPNKSKKQEAKPDEAASKVSSLDLNGDENAQDNEEDEGEGGSFEASRAKGREKQRVVLRPPRSLETTLFSRLLGLYGSGCKSLLDVQHRMNQEVSRGAVTFPCNIDLSSIHFQRIHRS